MFNTKKLCQNRYVTAKMLQHIVNPNQVVYFGYVYLDLINPSTSNMASTGIHYVLY